MNSTVSQEFGMFCSHTKHLKQILTETQICFKQINDAANINGSQPSPAELSEVEEKELESLVRRPPGIVILGQTAQAKATVVNEILGREVLPAYSGSECGIPQTPGRNERAHSKWRAVRLRYGKKQRVAFCLVNSFELVGESSCTEMAWTTVPLEVLRADGSHHSTLAERDNQDLTDVNEPESNSDMESLEGHSDTDTAYTEEIPQGNDAENETCDSDVDHLPCTQSTVPDGDLNEIDSTCTCSLTAISCTDRQESHDEVVLTGEPPSKEPKSDTNVMVEVTLNHPLFSDGAQIIVDENDDDVGDADVDKMTLDALVDAFTTDLVPIFVYALSCDIFSKQEIVRLKRLRELLPGIAVFFVKVPQVQQDRADPSSPISSIRCMLEHQVATLCNQARLSADGKNITRRKAVTTAQASLKLFQQLLEIGYLNILPGALPTDRQSRMVSDSDSADYYAVESDLAENFDNFSTHFVEFAHKVLHCHLVKVIGLLNVIHTRCLQTFIQSAFDMARDMMITPKRITFAKEKESELYTSLMTMALRKQDEIRKIIAETVAGKKDELIEKAADYEFVGVEILPTGEVSSSSDLKKCTRQIQDLVLGDLNSAIGDKLLGSVDILKDSYTGVLTRCLESLEQSDVENNKEMTRTSMALREILTSAYQVEITVRAGASIVKVLLEKMKQLMHSMPWHQAPRIDMEWKKQVATNMLNSLSEARLAKSVCSQIKERLKYSHETFSAALKQLEARHSGRLERTEEQRFRVRKVHAPRVARLALESTSFKDLLVYGMPTQGREIGRGQYGVVHACDKWGGFSPCAIKSVVPPDDRHWNDLAMEFFYTKNVPEHDRIVALRGSVVDHSYSGGNPAVLLIMDRLVQDLYTAIKSGLSWPNRLQVAIDVVEGIRYLHSQGLVHRDIKLKNVLLDKHNRGKLTDLGFCKPEAMMSGSIVGTPIHMAPELFSGHYDNSVDTYAFGILFWYVCAGHVHLPYNFEQCTNKEMLWTSVRRGVRPEKLAQFDQGCWELMQSCWDGDPSRRPLLGFVEPKLRSIHAKVLKHKSAKSRRKVPAQQESNSQGAAHS